MDKNKLIIFFERSFLSNLLSDKEVTDISYNGREFYYLHNLKGRLKADIDIDEREVRDFVRQLANMSQKQFSYQSPYLDISFGKYRFNAIHYSIGRYENDNAITFSIRIASSFIHIKDDGKFFPKEVGRLIDIIVASHKSIVIGGLTGSAKTEVQKYLLTRMEKSTRVIVIDNVLELDIHNIVPKLDLSIWQADERNPNTSIQFLVKNALRSNPDWLIVAESRGSEMIEVLNSALTGHPIITTIHSLDAYSMPVRMTRMVLMNEKKMSYDDVFFDICYNFNFYFYLKRIITDDGMVHRYLDTILYIDRSNNKNIIYQRKDDKDHFGLLDDEILSSLKYSNDDYLFLSTFTKMKYLFQSLKYLSFNISNRIEMKEGDHCA